MADLRARPSLAQNSPSQFFVLNALINAGVQPAESTSLTRMRSRPPRRSTRKRLAGGELAPDIATGVKATRSSSRWDYEQADRDAVRAATLPTTTRTSWKD
jgi:hypothetical protein